MRKLTYILGSVACLAIVGSPAFASDAPTLRIENFIGTVNVETGNYDRVTIVDADGAKINKTSQGATIDNGDSVRNINCRYRLNKLSIRQGKGSWRKGGKGYKSIDEYPSLKIRAPRNTHIEINHALVIGRVGDFGSGDIHIGSCGDIVFGDVAGNLSLGVSGSGDVEMGNVGGRLDLGISGSGDTDMGSGHGAEIHVSGSGDLVAENFDSVDLSISGSGDVELQDISGSLEVGSSGSSDIVVGKVAGSIKFSGSGSSDLDADYVGGDLWVRLSGSSDVNVARGNAKDVYVKASGASDVFYGGASVNVEAYAGGASNVSLKVPSGSLSTHEGGAGDVRMSK
jgi:hypothetical protein